MVTSSEKSASLARRLHTLANVDQNIKAARQQAIAHQNMIEKLSEPLNAVSAKLGKLEQSQASVAVAGERKIESLTTGLEKKIEKLKADTTAKIEQTKAETKAKIEALQNDQSSSENALMLEYAEAIVRFSFEGSNSDLGTVLGVGLKEAKNLIESSKSELEKAGISVTPHLEAPADTTAVDEKSSPSTSNSGADGRSS
ncbi:hypothetical protein FEZ60_25075 [Rhodococcus sp. MS16]|uniref:hypothetical protein n=1 Tax=Rhodococcus sp. MS16 TaxID=2579941 RepID=UPI001562802D|nr:hypothetical protein [Rhodococcus sp. MS16]NRI68797.1 hypothetical protein [Rhodococcus sp. MS16]